MVVAISQVAAALLGVHQPGPVDPAAIRRMRRALDLSQDEASELVGVARNTWARWEAGSMEPHPLMWVHLSAVIAQLRGMRLAEDRAQEHAGW